jgi:hypothetical protein
MERGSGVMADGVHDVTERYFTNWRPLVRIALADLPRYGDAAAVYAIRSKNGEILKFGSTENLRNRLFKNCIGGAGGGTTQWIHNLLFAQSHIAEVEFAWVEINKYQEMEKQLTQAYQEEHGQLPRWMKR